MENDPSGEMEVILGADTGEGYVMLNKVFTDKVSKQSVDGDDVDLSGKTIALFLGDSNSDKSRPPVYEYLMNPESEVLLNDDKGDYYYLDYLELEYGKIADAFEADLGMVTKIPRDYKFRVSLNDQENKIILQSNGGMKEYLPKLVSFTEFDRALNKYIDGLTETELVGLDTFGKEIKIKKI